MNQIELDEFRKQSFEINNRRAVVQTKLDEAGIGANVIERINATQKIIGKIVGRLSERINSQLIYDFIENVPMGIINKHTNPAIIAKHAIIIGLVGVISEYIDWDVNEAISIAADILDDVNAHTEAAEVRSMGGNN